MRKLYCNKFVERKKIRVIFNSKNRGFSAGNNVGLRVAIQEGAELIINPDVELRYSNYISHVMEEVKNWPDVAVVGTNVVLPNGEKQNPMYEMTAIEEILWPLGINKKRLARWSDKNKTGYCDKVCGCCFFISKKFLEKNNYLDESVFMYCEEPILAKSVIRFGLKELYINEVTANHEHYVQQKNKNFKTRMLYFLESRIYYIKKYSEYGVVLKKIAICSRKIQMLMWKYKKDKGKNR